MRDLTVLKFGGSVLRGEADLARGVHEAYRWVREGTRVVVVVSAFEGTTDGLVKRAASYVEDADEEAARALVATGELTTASLLGLALRKAGVPARVLNPHQIALRTEGPGADARTAGVCTEAIRAALEDVPVVVIPGFVGIDGGGAYTLLGRGGSDLTALFLAAELGARRCRLIKDVDGLYERDPAGPGPRPRKFERCSWDEALKLDGGIVQHKAVRLARERRLEFEVGAFGREDGTVVGESSEQRAANSEQRTARATAEPVAHATHYHRRLRVVLLGAGTVGGGVYEHLLRERERFRVVRIAVRDVERAAARGLPRELLTDDAVSAARENCDVVVELIGGLEPPEMAVRAALGSGRHVVTANKRLIAERGAELETLARRHGATLRYSAAVGGGVPMLETVRRSALRGRVHSLEGVINGTSNFVLDRLAGGATFEIAVAEAQERGLAERDPGADLSGLDAAQKLSLLCLEAWGVRVPIGSIRLEGITAERVDALRGSGPGVVRQVAWARWTEQGVAAGVELRRLRSDDALVCRGAGNALVVHTESGEHRMSGTGAGRWPTAESVMADLLELEREEADPGKDARATTGKDARATGDASGVATGDSQRRDGGATGVLSGGSGANIPPHCLAPNRGVPFLQPNETHECEQPNSAPALA